MSARRKPRSESGANVFIHPSQFPDAVERELVRSLRAHEVNHKFHYQTREQARKWLALHEAHSPARNDRECLATYDRAFVEVAKTIEAGKVQVVGLGCGGGQKDVRLLELLEAPRRKLTYVPCDVSVPLVLVARSHALQLLPDLEINPVVCDLALADDLPAAIPRVPAAQRLVTFFGMIPNFEPRLILPRLVQFLDPGDLLLFSANLLPSAFPGAMREILPQYDNELTRDWLMILLLDLGIERSDGRFEFAIETIKFPFDIPRFVARFHFLRSRTVNLGTETVRFARGESIRLFFSCRYTPESLGRLLRLSRPAVRQSWITASGQEGVFLVSPS